MASTIQLKSGTSSAIPSSLAQGEIAMNVDNGLFYYGSGSANKVKPLDAFTHITSSGNISSSGDVYASNIQIPLGGQIVFAGDTNTGIKSLSNPEDLDIYADRHLRLQPDSDISIHEGSTQYALFDGGNKSLVLSHAAGGHITASGAISASGVFRMGTPGARQEHYLYGRLNVIGSDVTIGDGNITASGNIEIEGDISASAASTASFSHIITAGDTIEFVEGATKLGELKFDATDGLTTNDASGNNKQNKMGVSKYNTGSHTATSAAQGEIVNFPDQGSLTAGEIYYLKTNGQWASAQADSVGTSTGSLAVALGANAQTNGMLLRGMVKMENDPATLPGEPLYLSDGTRGRVTKTCPSSNNDVARIVGYYISGSGVIYFNPDNTYVVVTA